MIKRIVIVLVLVFGFWQGHGQATLANMETDYNARFYEYDSVYLYENLFWENDRNIYFVSRPFNNAMKMWQATGKRMYLDRCMKAVDIYIGHSAPIESPYSAYLGWNKSPLFADKQNDVGWLYGIPLSESYTFRYVTTLLRHLYNSPTLRGSDSEIESWYQNTLSFVEKHIWEKWETIGEHHMYRINSHMTSHWSRMGYDLWVITGKSKYATLYNDVMYIGDNVRRVRGSSINYDHLWDLFADGGGLIYDNSTLNGGGMMGMSAWSDAQGSVNDFSHYADIFDFFVELYWEGELPNLSDGTTPAEVLERFANQWVQKGWVSRDPYDWNYSMDGTGFREKTVYHIQYGLWTFDPTSTIYLEYKDAYESSDSGTNEFEVGDNEAGMYGVFALGLSIQDNGCPFYPENWAFGNCGTTNPNPNPNPTPITGTGKKKGIIIN